MAFIVQQQGRTVCVITLPACRRWTSQPIIRSAVLAARRHRARLRVRRANSIDRFSRRLVSVSFTHHRLRSAIGIDDASAADRRSRWSLPLIGPNCVSESPVRQSVRLPMDGKLSGVSGPQIRRRPVKERRDASRRSGESLLNNDFIIALMS